MENFKHFRPLLACYGGGHVEIILSVAEALIKYQGNPEILGFTTAYRTLVDKGFPAHSVRVLLEEENNLEWLELADQFTHGVSHPDICQKETRAYFAIGLKDLCKKHGKRVAIEMVKRHGRKVFEPVETFRKYIKKTKPDFVIATTSPRFETALLKAARIEGVPHLAIGDLFLRKELEWMTSSGYAQNIAVLSNEVARHLIDAGIGGESIFVTGNPAFDKLSMVKKDIERRDKLRKKIGFTEKTVILYPAPSSKISQNGRAFADIYKTIQLLDEFCVKHSEFAYVVRQHPNLPLSKSLNLSRGYFDDGRLMTPEETILMSDVVLVEASTMGLQAALMGKKVFVVGFSDYVVYPEFGLAQSALSFQEALSKLGEGNVHFKNVAGIDIWPSATERVLQVINQIRNRDLRSYD